MYNKKSVGSEEPIRIYSIGSDLEIIEEYNEQMKHVGRQDISNVLVKHDFKI